MSKNEKPRPTGGTVAQGKGQDSNHNNFTTSTSNLQAIYDLLPEGEARAISSKSLAELVGASSVRELQSRIAVERDQGKLILSTCRNGGGYFRPSPGDDGQAEINRFIATLKARALNTLRALRAARLAQSEIDGQIGLDDLQTAFDVLEVL